MSQPFLGIYTAIYDYQAQNDEELSIAENDILYLLQKSDFDDWWCVKKRVLDENIEEPQGLVPKTYISPATPSSKAIALYDYTSQTVEELSFAEGTTLNVYDNSDPNWTLVDIDNKQFGFVPGNYIEIQTNNPTPAITTIPPTMGLTPFPQPATRAATTTSAPSMPITQSFPAPPQRNDRIRPPSSSKQYQNDVNDDYDDEESVPPMPSRPNGNSSSTRKKSYSNYDDDDDDDNNNNDYSDREDNKNNTKSESKSFFSSPSKKNRSRSNTASSRRKSISNFLNPSSKDEEIKPMKGDFAWKVFEIEGKKKRSGVLEIGNGKIYIDIEKKLNDSWPISNLLNYNAEKKHVFLDFRSPSDSFELRVDSKDSAQAIISILGDMKGLQSQSALSDVKNAQREGYEAALSSNYKNGVLLYDFDGADNDELTCSEGDSVKIINDTKSKEWWMVENVRGKRGVVPANYVKIVSDKSLSKSKKNNNSKESQGFIKTLLGPHPSKKKSSKNSKDKDREELELREKARLKMEREELSKQRQRMEMKEKELILRDKEQRDKIRRADERLRERRIREKTKSNGSANSNGSSSNNSKDFNTPNPRRIRTWIDRSGSFKVEAEFLGVQQGKIHLHKSNGVKIAVAASKLSNEDLEYVERLTGTSLESYKENAKQIPSSTISSSNIESSKSSKSSKSRESTPTLPSRETSSAVAHQRTNAIPLRADLIDYWFNLCVESGVDASVCDRYARNFAQEQVDESVLDAISPALMRTLGVREGDILKIKKKIDSLLGNNNNSNNNILGKNPADPLPNPPTTSMSDDEWTTKPAAQSINQITASTPTPTSTSTPAPAATPVKTLTPQITGSIKDLLDIKPMEPTKTGITPVKTINTIGTATPTQSITPAPVSTQKTGTILPSITGMHPMPMVAMPTGFMPITMVPMMTGMITGMPTGTIRTGGLTTGLTGGLNMMNSLTTGGLTMPTTTFGVNSLAQQPIQQKTGSNNGFILPLTTGSMPTTTFGGAGNVGNMVKLQPTGVKLQKTGNGLFQTNGSSIPPMQPTMKTGGGFIPQSTFGMQLNNAITGGFQQQPQPQPVTSFFNPALTGGMGMNPAMTGGFPQTSFGVPALTGGMAMNPALTGRLGMNMPVTSFGNPALTGGINNNMNMNNMNMNMMNNGMNNVNMNMNPALTGGLGMNNMPLTSFGNPALTGGMMNNNISNNNNNNNNNNMYLNPTLTGTLPPTSFGNTNNVELQAQPTGFGFGNSGNSGRQANLANATADNPFGF